MWSPEFLRIFAINLTIISVFALALFTVFNGFFGTFADASHAVRAILAPDGFAVFQSDI